MLFRANAAVLPEFLELVINSPWLREFAKEKTTGGAAPRVNMTVVRGYPIPIPPLAEQERILARVAELDDLCVKAANGIDDGLSRQSLLADALFKAFAS
jgi:type I restriction enzyme S subunit